MVGSNMTVLEGLPRTESEAVRKEHAMEWLADLDDPSAEEIVDVVVPKPYKKKGRTFAKPYSDVRIKGDAEFVETVAGLLRPFLACEATGTRLAINLQKVENKETGEITDTWALYLKSVERGSGRKPGTLDSIPDDLHAIRR